VPGTEREKRGRDDEPARNKMTGVRNLSNKESLTMKQNKTHLTKIGIISIAAILGLLAASIALYVGSPEKNVRIETQYAPQQASYAINNVDSLTIDEELVADASMDLAALDITAGDMDLATQEVPEPASMGLLGIGGLALLRRRRNRK
jgi:hypothetical protein